MKSFITAAVAFAATVSAQAAQIPGYTRRFHGDFAIRAPTDPSCWTYMQVERFYDGEFDAARCARVCEETTRFNQQFLNSRATCRFFNTYVLEEDGEYYAQECALYTRTWGPQLATNDGYEYDGTFYTVRDSYSYFNTADPGNANSCIRQDVPGSPDETIAPGTPVPPTETATNTGAPATTTTSRAAAPTTTTAPASTTAVTSPAGTATTTAAAGTTTTPATTVVPTTILTTTSAAAPTTSAPSGPGAPQCFRLRGVTGRNLINGRWLDGRFRSASIFRNQERRASVFTIEGGQLRQQGTDYFAYNDQRLNRNYGRVDFDLRGIARRSNDVLLQGCQIQSRTFLGVNGQYLSCANGAFGYDASYLAQGSGFNEEVGMLVVPTSC